MSDLPAGYEISTDPARLDVDAIHAYLSRSYWSAEILREVVAKAVTNSLCFGLYYSGDHTDVEQQVGLARVITDYTTFAYLCDVYVLEEHRGRGLGKSLMQAVLSHRDLQGLRRFNLVTQDAHELYRQYGFTDLKHPSRHMEMVDLDIYKRAAKAKKRA